MTMAAGIEAGLTLIELMDRLAAIWQQRQQAAADLAAARNAADSAAAQERMEMAHAAALAIHAQIQTLRMEGGGP